MKANQEIVACATSHVVIDWQAIDWHKVNQNVHRLQTSIVKVSQIICCCETTSRKGRYKGLSRMW